MVIQLILTSYYFSESPLKRNDMKQIATKLFLGFYLRRRTSSEGYIDENIEQVVSVVKQKVLMV